LLRRRLTFSGSADQRYAGVTTRSLLSEFVAA
jgi:hypothetical protein